MSQQQRLLPLPLIGMILLGLLIGLYLATGKRSSKDDSAKNSASHAVDTSPENALNYWTAKKMRNAKPARMPEVNTLKPAKEPPQAPSTASDEHQS